MIKRLTYHRVKSKQYKRIVAILLMVVIALPLIIKPAHYLFIKHKHFHYQSENSISQGGTHFRCTIDNFHFTEITVHSLTYKTPFVAVFSTLKIVLPPVLSKQETILPFALRAPPLWNKEA